MEFLGTNIDLQQAELKNPVFQIGVPGNLIEAQFYYNPVTKIPYYFHGSVSIPLAGGAGNLDGGSAASIYGGTLPIDGGTSSSF